MEKPIGAPTSFVERATLMNDLLVVAFRADITRVATLIYAKERARILSGTPDSQRTTSADAPSQPRR
jgi:hypothetical protein